MKDSKQLLRCGKRAIESILVASLITLGSCFDSGKSKSEPSASYAERTDSSPLLCPVEAGKFDTNAPNVTAKIKDTQGNNYALLQTYAESPEQRVTLEKDSIFYLVDFNNISNINRLADNAVRVDLRNGNKLEGDWVPNDRPLNFYQDSGNPSQEGYIFGVVSKIPSRIMIKDITSLIFGQPSAVTNDSGNISDEQSKYPKKIVLQDDSVIDTSRGYVADFCGHWWSSTVHKRLEDECRTVSNSIPLKDVSEIVFREDSDSPDSQCRKVVIKFKDGREQADSLYLTSESYGGSCNSSLRFRDFDKFFAAQNGYDLLIPLDNVKKVIPLPDK